MKVTILSKIDFAGSGLRLCNLIRREGVDCDILTAKQGIGNPKLAIETPKKKSKKYIQRRISESDIIHFKGDWNYTTKWAGVTLPNVKKIQTFSGSFFRRGREACVSMPLAEISDYKADFLSAFTPDLCYNESIKLMEIPCLNLDYQFKKKDKFTVLHIPSSPEKKGSDIIEEAFYLLRRRDVEFVSCTNIPHYQVMDMKRNCSLYIDQMLLPVYGNAAVEAMSFGIPVMNWDEGLYPYDTPIIKPKERTAEAIAESIERWLDWDRLRELSEQTFDYCKRIHGDVGKRWKTKYEEICQ